MLWQWPSKRRGVKGRHIVLRWFRVFSVYFKTSTSDCAAHYFYKSRVHVWYQPIICNIWRWLLITLYTTLLLSHVRKSLSDNFFSWNFVNNTDVVLFQGNDSMHDGADDSDMCGLPGWSDVARGACHPGQWNRAIKTPWIFLRAHLVSIGLQGNLDRYAEITLTPYSKYWNKTIACNGY